MTNQDAIRYLKTIKDILPYHNMQAQAIDHVIKQLAEPSDADVAEAIDIIEKNWPPENYTMLREALTLAIEIMRQYQKPTGDTSDGYHTFNDLYHHRAILFAALSKAYPEKAWKSLKHHDGTMFGDDWFICGIETPKGQYTYHYNTTYWHLFAGKILDNAPEWDGHKPEDVERLMSLQGYQKPTDEAVHPDDLDAATEDAVEWLEHMKSCHIDSWNKADDEDTAEPGAYEQYKATLKALDLAIQGLRQMRMEPWIPVSERLPTEDDADEKGNVLCYWTDEAIETYQARWVDEWNSDRNHKDKITHWRPLPAPPERSAG